jgi:hypothetical protein
VLRVLGALAALVQTVCNEGTVGIGSGDEGWQGKGKVSAVP